MTMPRETYLGYVKISDSLYFGTLGLVLPPLPRSVHAIAYEEQ